MSKEALPRKKKIRAGHRASATRLLNQVDGALAATPTDNDKLAQLKLSLHEKLETLKQLDSEVVDLTPEEGLDEEIEQADGYKDNVYRALTMIDKALKPKPSPPTPTATSSSTSMSPAVTPHVNRVKLPKLSLPHFSGNITKWDTFWDSYESAIHKNDDLTDIDKFNYLRSLLERTAHEAIAGLTLSSANYQEAIDILQKRFGNKQLIISKHMEILLNIEAITSEQNVRGLRRLYDDVESHIRSLKSLGVAPDSYGALLSPVLLNKLPPELRLIVSRKIPDSTLDIDSLLKIVEEELLARERTQAPTQTLPRRNQDKPRSTATTLFSGAPSPASSPTCCYCQQPHSSTECTTVSSISARKQILRTSGRCFNCLRKGHLVRNCRSPRRCQRCNGRHHSSICEGRSLERTPSGVDQLSLAQPTSTPLNPEAPPFTTTPTSSNLCTDGMKAVLLQTARASIYNPAQPHRSIEVRVLLDSGSQKLYISERAKGQLALQPTGEQHLCIATFGSTREGPKVCQIVTIGMVGKGYPHMQLSLYVVPMICEPLASQPIAACTKQNQHLASLELADYCDSDQSLEVDILVGSDHYWDLVTGGISRGSGGPTAIHTKLGWVLSGPTRSREADHCSMNLVTTHVLRVDTQQNDSKSLDETLRSFWDLESLGIREPEKTMYDEFANTIAFRDGRYMVSLPWKEFHSPLPDNYQLSHNRLRGLLHRLKQTPSILREYDDIIRDQVDKGIVEPVTETDPALSQLHYLPHHAVIRTDKTTTKLRIVYDASAKSNGPSLNDCLHTGPKFNQLILDILMRFRSFRVALTADIEKAFLMISVAEHDRDALRFLWVNDLAKDPPDIRILRFTRVVFGVSSSPFLLNATIKYHLEQYLESYPDTIRCLLQSTYVDDIIAGAASEDEAFDLYAQAKEILQRGGFNLRKFLTNSRHLQLRIDQAEKSRNQPKKIVREECPHYLDETYAEATLGSNPGQGAGEQRILGVRWEPNSDQLIFDIAEIAQLAGTLEPTKRNVVSTIGRFYDPLGFLSPLIIKFKVLFQKLCESKVDWDQTLTGELVQEWKTLITELQENQPISIPRSYLANVNGEVASYELYGFCDASVKAYAAVVYLVLKTEEETFVRFVVAKTRVAPLQAQTIPRLELLSALLLSRLITTVSNSLKSTLQQLELRCFTDSQVALFWIHGIDKDWKPFVRNRVAEIRRLVPPNCWSHCSGETNPADLPSRGLSLIELSVNQLWRHGPEWLGTKLISQDETDSVSMPEGCATEMKAKNQPSHNLLTPNPKQTVGEIMDYRNYSTLSRLLRVTTYVLRAVKRFKAGSTALTRCTTLTTEELSDSERQWITYVQMQLTREKSFSTWQKQLDLFVDNKGLWRCGGRLANADIPYSTKHPVLLPRDHPFTAMIVRDAHERVGHNGVKETLTEVRAKFWIVKGRSLVRSIIHRCILCRRFEGAAYHAPPPPPLPEFRVKEEPPFTFTGVDFAGPLYIRSFGLTASNKVWICLFTCCVTRAIHLDIVTDLSTETFLRCLKRFAARRGMPRKFVSDNGKTFKAAAKFIKAVFKDDVVLEHLSGLGVEWKFNLEKAPWWGGIFERLVKSTKRCLRKMVGQAKLSLDELQTAIVEIESIVNSRPLSYLASSDMEEPLTPSHLLIGRRVLNLPDNLGYIVEAGDEEFMIDTSQLDRRLKHLNNILNQFWKRWRTEYLTELRESHRQTHRDYSSQPVIEVGDVVVVHDEGLPRGFWKLGKIQEMIVGRDGKIRGATVKVASRNRQHSLLRRPIQLLYPLEVRSEPENLIEMEPESESHSQEESISNEIPQSPPDQEPRRRSQRSAAKQADDRRKACMLELQN